MPKDEISKAAKSLSKLGSSKGGRKRAEALSPENRSEIARKAASARWQRLQGIDSSSDEIPWAVAEGQLKFLDREVYCAVLDNGKRVLAQQGVLIAMGRARTPSAGQGASKEGLPAFLRASNLRPFISEELIQATKPIIYKPLSGGYTEQGKYRSIAFGCDAEAFPAVLKVYVDAEDAGALLATQKHIARNARTILKALENVAMIALVDEATDWQSVRPHEELQRILAAYVLPEHLPWIKTVPIEFTKQVYKLWGWNLKDNMQGPRYVSKLIRKYIYEPMPKGVLEELDQLNPPNDKWQRRHKHFQYLTTEIGLQHFKSQIVGVMALMRASTTRQEFEELFQRAYGLGYQQEFHFELEAPEQPPQITQPSSTLNVDA